jgi:Tfp pilus assembly PilM family ATPase
VTIGRTIGFTLKQASARNKAGRKTAPVAKRAEAVLCRGLGIIKDGEVVTEQAMAEFAARFQGQVTQEVIDAMKVLFNIATEDEDEVDQALIQGGGAAALDLEDEVDGTADV